MWKWGTAAIATIFTSTVVQIAIKKFIFKIEPFTIVQQVIGFVLAIVFLNLYRIAIEKAAQQERVPDAGDSSQ